MLLERESWRDFQGAGVETELSQKLSAKFSLSTKSFFWILSLQALEFQVKFFYSEIFLREAM